MQPGKQQGAEIGKGGANGMSLFAVYVPEGNREPAKSEIRQSHEIHPLPDLRVLLTRLAESREIAFHVSKEYRDALQAEFFRQTLKGDCLPGACRTCDEPVTVGHARQKRYRLPGLSDDDGFCCIHEECSCECFV